MVPPDAAPTSRLSFTILFDEPFWIGLVELLDGERLGVARHVFGGEPSPPEVEEFVRREGLALLCRAAAGTIRLADAPAAAARVNPKRALREAREATAARGIASKSQEALRLQLEEHKQERRVASRAEREAEEERRRAIARQKAREKHRGH